MILVTGGLGFIGSHVTRALIDVGEACIVTQHRNQRVASFLDDELDKRMFIEPLDLNDQAALLTLNKKGDITGIVHLASPGRGGLRPAEEFQVCVTWLTNLLEAANAWKVTRVTLASTVGVYSGIMEVPWREDMALPIASPHPIPASKKVSEIIAHVVAAHSRLDCVSVRIGGIYGPLQAADRTLPSRLVHAAVNGMRPDLSAGGFYSLYADEGMDLCYVKDCARGIALVQTAKTLHYPIYNVAYGRPTFNKEIAAAVKKVIPNADIQLPEGNDPGGIGVVPYQDISRIHEDTGYEPQFSIDAAIADYTAWLQANREV